MRNYLSTIKYITKGITTSFLKIMSVLIIILLSSETYAQNSLVIKTLEQANAYIEHKDFYDALMVLEQFENTYQGDIYVERLYAQTLFWIQDYEESKKIYERAISYHPNNVDVRIEYATMLMDIGDYHSAKKHLTFVLKSSPQNGSANFILGKILFYEGHFIQSYDKLLLAHSQYPQNKEISGLKKQVYKIIRPKIFLNGLHRSDQQPLSKTGSSIKINYFKSNMLNPGIETSIYAYSNKSSANLISTFKFSNKFRFIKSGITINLAAGMIHSKTESINQFTGVFHFSKKFKIPVNIDFIASRKNYEYTSLSAEELLMISNLKMNIAIGNPKSFNGALGSQYTFFPDQNMVSSYYLWALSKPVKFSQFKLFFGYSLSHMNSKEDRFEPNESLDEILINPTKEISGFYPYYTPIDLWSNSVLFKLQYQIKDGFYINTHASVGVYSHISVPYFYLDYSGNNKLMIRKDFVNEQYIPMDIGLDMNTIITKNFEMTISYKYLSTYYFLSHFVDLGIKIYL